MDVFLQDSRDVCPHLYVLFCLQAHRHRQSELRATQGVSLSPVCRNANVAFWPQGDRLPADS